MNVVKIAEEIARKWMERLDFCRDMRGHIVELGDLSAVLPFEGVFRHLIIDASASLLRHYGADVNIDGHLDGHC